MRFRNQYSSLIMYFTFCILTVLSFTFGYITTTSRVRQIDISSQFGSYEGTSQSINDSNYMTVASRDSALSENTLFIVKTQYLGCGHIINTTTGLPKELTQHTELEFKLKYKDLVVEKFTPEEIITVKQINGKCPNHYIIKAKDSKIAVYYQNSEALKEVTNISVSELPINDQKELQTGINVDSSEMLAQLLENFGS